MGFLGIEEFRIKGFGDLGPEGLGIKLFRVLLIMVFPDSEIVGTYWNRDLEISKFGIEGSRDFGF